MKILETGEWLTLYFIVKNWAFILNIAHCFTMFTGKFKNSPLDMNYFDNICFLNKRLKIA